ncbi:MAG: hypothetical protein ABSD20_03270 [Terriglobales bacterium]|jgi:hypothetical protein
MSRRNEVVLILTICLALAITGCTSSSNSCYAPAPTGSYSNSSFSGLYAFSLMGANSSGFFSAAGSLQADGAGNITSGVIDFNGVSGNFTNASISGTYAITADGRGLATLNSSFTTIGLDFVLVANGTALIIRFDQIGTASGTMSPQSPSAFSATSLTGPLAFGLNGVDESYALESAAGNFSTDGTSMITGGVLDVNDFGTANLSQAVTGSFASPSSTSGRGTLQMIAVTPSSTQTLNFAYYILDATHVKLIEIDTPGSAPILAGDGFIQSSSISNASFSGPYAFTLGGATSSSTPYVAGGIITADGAGNIEAGGVMDVNNNGAVNQSLSTSGNYSLAGNGRGTLALTSTTGTSNFVIYPTSTSGVLMLEIDTSPLLSGSAYSQQTSGFSASTLNGLYGYNSSGVASGSEIDSIAQFTANGSGVLKGTVDINAPGSLVNGSALNGTYSMTSNGRGNATLNSCTASQNFVVYGINSSQALLLEIDSNPITLGVFAQQ